LKVPERRGCVTNCRGWKAEYSDRLGSQTQRDSLKVQVSK